MNFQAGKTITAKKTGSNRDARPRSSTPKDSLTVPLLRGDNITHDDHSHNDITRDDHSHNDVTRDDIEREKKNLNLDNFIRKLSMPGDLLDINLICRSTLNSFGAT